MKKTFFLALASLAFAIGFTCCSGGGGNSETSPAALFFKGQTIEVKSGAILRFEFSDELWGYSTNVLPCVISAEGAAKVPATVTVKEYTLAEGSSESSDRPEFATMKLMVQYDTGVIPQNDTHVTFWGFPPDAIEISLGGDGAEMDMLFRDEKHGSCLLTVKKGAKFSTPADNKSEYVVNADNLYDLVGKDGVENKVGGTGEFTFFK